MKHIVAALAILLAGQALAQDKPSPAKMGIDTQTPQNVSVLDASKTWALIGTVDPGTHVFIPVGGAAGGGGGTFTWPGTAGVDIGNAGTAGTMPFVNTYLNGLLPGFRTPPTVNLGNLFTAGNPGIIACLDGTNNCFGGGSGGGSFTWPGTAGVAIGGGTSTGTMPFVNAYLNGLLPGFASTPTVNIGTTGALATAVNQTSGNQLTRITADGTTTLFGATIPGRIACPDGTTACFGVAWPGTAGVAAPGAGTAGTMPFVNAYLNGTLPAFAAPPTVNIGSAGTLATAANQTSGGQKVQNVDVAGNTIFVTGRPGLIACPDGTTACFGGSGGSFTWPGTAAVAVGGAGSAGTMPFVNAYLNGTLPAFASPPTVLLGSLFTSGNPGNVNCVTGCSSSGGGGATPFLKTNTYTPIAAGTGSLSTSISTGAPTTIVAVNVGQTSGAHCAPGATATSSDHYLSPGGGWFAWNPSGATTFACITDSGTTTVNVSGGSGLPTGSGGGGGGSTGSSGNVFQATKFAQGTLTAAGTTSVITASGSLTVYLVNYSENTDSIATGAADFQIVSGTGTNCATVNQSITPLRSFTANNGIVEGSIGVVGASNAGDALCVKTTTASSVNPVKYRIGVAQQ